MSIYNIQLQVQKEIVLYVADSIAYLHNFSEDKPCLKDYNEELSKYIWTLNIISLSEMIS